MKDISERPIVIPKATIDLLLKQEEPLGLIGLYLFYYYTAILQKTDQPRTTSKHITTYLKITQGQIQRYEAKLIEIGLIGKNEIQTGNNNIHNKGIISK